MHKPALLSFALSLAAAPAASEPEPPRITFGIGAESYQETYREYRHGSRRIMQQQGGLWSLDGNAEYPFDNRHSAAASLRYSRGKSDYTGTTLDARPDSPLITYRGSPRETYGAQLTYRYKHPLPENGRHTLLLEAGAGWRTLKDMPRRLNPNDYDRTHRTLYARIGAGAHIRLPRSWEITPSAAYLHMLQGRQRSRNHRFDLTLKQKNGKGAEAALPVSKRFSKQSRISVGPFYRGWKVFDSESGYLSADGQAFAVVEPKNYTREAGIRIEYLF